MFDRIARMPLRDFDRWRPGELQSRMSSDLGLMTDAISISLPQFVQVTVTFIAALIYMLWLDWFLAVVLFVTAPVIAFVVGKFNALIVAGTKRAQERIADLSSNLIEVLQNERIVKAFRREDFERDRFAGANERYFGAYMKVTQFNQTQAPVLATVVMIALCAIIALTAREVSVGRLSPATAWGFWTATGLLINPMNRFSIFFADFARAFVGAGRVFEILDLPVEPDDPPDAVPLPGVVGDVRFENVSFAYDEGRPVLSNFSAEMLHGEVVALVGPSGAGKSTIVNLVPRFYEPQGGRITVDGTDIARVRLGDLRNAIAIVPQETQLFNGTIADNIRYGRLEARDDEVLAAAREANADEFVRAAPRRLRHAGRRARHPPLRRPAPAPGDRARDPARPAHPDPRRGHQRARLALRGADRRRARPSLARPHDADHRAPALDDPPRDQDPLHRSRRRPRDGHARRPDRRGRPVREPPRRPVRALTRGRARVSRGQFAV